MDEHRDEVRVEPVGPKGVSRAVPILTFLVGIFLGAALVKPWDLLLPPTTAAPVAPGPSVAAANPTPIPSSAPTASPGPVECAFAGGWRVFALGQQDRLGGDGSTTGGSEPSAGPDFKDIGNPLRRWLEIVPLPSVSGPVDERIPLVTIVSSRITGVGYCPPPGGADGPPADAGLKAWRLDGPGAATEIQLQPVAGGGTIPTEIKVYIGSDDAAGGRWPPGRYVFAVASSTTDYGRWFGLEIRTPPGPPSNG